MSNFMKICLVGAELFRAEGYTDIQTDGQADRQSDRQVDIKVRRWTDRKTDIAKLTVAFRGFTKALKTRSHIPFPLILGIRHTLRIFVNNIPYQAS
jgi:hypothetical protein